MRLSGILPLISLCLGLAAGTLPVFAQQPSDAGAYNSEAAALAQQARDWEAGGDTKRAIADYRKSVKLYPLAPTAPAAQFRLGQLYDSVGASKRAFESYQELLKNYPQAREFDEAVNSMTAIADTAMENRRYDRATEMYEAIMADAPYAKFAPAIQFKLGQSLENQKEYDKATAAYQVIIDRYPTSKYASDALYQIGYVQYTESTSRSKDLSAAVDARNTFDEFLFEHPGSEKAAQARENLAQMSNRESTDLLSIAKFYDRSENYRAAVIYYADVVRRQPGTEDSTFAQQRIEEIRATVGEEELRAGTERAETGELAALRRRTQNQVQTSALSNYSGPPVSAVAPPEELPAPKPRLRTSADDVRPQSEPAGPDLMTPPADLPPVEPELPPLE
jgi:outer membrane protein assembly factor BamD